VSVPELAITDKEFAGLRDLIHAHAGIALAPCKRYLVQARLARRLRELGLSTFADYHERLTGDASGAELTHFINAMTTNKTDFFREAHHFEHLSSKWLATRGPGAARRLRFWSAACSTGEEPYTLAVTLLDALAGGAGWDVRILASDIDTEVLARAAEGVYSTEQVAPVPRPLLQRYFLRGTGSYAGTFRVGPAARGLVTFRRINFLDEPWPIRTRFDAIFCRNVLIYFDRPTQQRVLARLAACLVEDGLLFLGHSESAHGLVDGVRAVGPTIYQRVPTGDSSPAPAGR
jgi:chemotaxis protein methyltransferase CheR